MQATETQATQADKPARNTKPQPLHAAQIAEALLKLSTAAQISGVSESTLYRKAAADPSFPKLIKMGKRCTRIQAGAFMAWLSKQAEA